MKLFLKNIQVFIFLLLITVGNSFAQSDNKKDLKKLHDLQNEDTEPAFKEFKTPKEYTNESMVMMAEKFKLIQSKISKKPTANNPYPEQYAAYARIRVKLNDLNAIEQYSDFSFQEGDEIEIKIVKADGKITEIDLKDAVDGENVKTSNSYYNYYYLSSKKKKIAIKNLEIGDIVDFSSYYKYTNYYYETTYFTNLPSMPIVYLKNEILVNKNNTAVFFKNFNGAKPLTKKTAGKQIQYGFESEMINKRKDEIMSNDFQSDPYFRLIVYFNTTYNYVFETKPKKNDLITKLDNKDLLEYAVKTVKSSWGSGRNGNSSNYLQFLKSDDVYNLSDEDYMKKYYVICRDNAFLSDLAFNFKEQSYGLPLLTNFMEHLGRRDIPYEVLMFASKHVSPIKDIIDPDDFLWGLRYKLKGKYYYITSFNSNSQINDISEIFENTDAYALQGIFGPKSKLKISTITMPTSTNENNVYTINIDANFNSTLDSLKLNVKTETTGYQSAFDRFNLIKNNNYFEEYVKFLNDRKVIKKSKPFFYFAGENYYGAKKDFVLKEEERIKKDYFDNLNKEKKENVEKAAKEEYYVLKYEKYESLNDGRSIKNPNPAWKEEFTIGNTLKPAGNNKVFEIGHVLGELSKVNSNDDRTNRTKPFFIDFNKTFTMKVNIKIPQGKMPVGLEQLNVSVNNSIGSITSTAKVENGVIVWNLTKKLNGFRHEATKWNEFLNITDAGTQLNNAKILFK